MGFGRSGLRLSCIGPGFLYSLRRIFFAEIVQYLWNFGQIFFMRKHYLSIGHFFKNAQSIEEKYEFSFDNFKTTQSIEIACIYLHASILNWLGLEIYPINWECLHIPINKHSLLIGYFLESNSFGATRYMPNKLRMLAYTSKPAFSID